MARLRIPLGLPLLLFLGSAVLGVVTAYSTPASLIDFALIAAGIALYLLIVQTRYSEAFGLWTVILLSLGASLLVVLFVSTHDFGQSPIKFGVINRIGLSISRVFSNSQTTSLHPNNLAGMLELALPVIIALAVSLARQKRWLGSIAAIAAASFMLFGLVLTGSRGAWLGLLLVGAAFLNVWIAKQIKRSGHGLFFVLGALVFLLCLFLVALLAGLPFEESVQRLYSLAQAKAGEIPRPELYRQVWELVQDYFFTGSGLGTFPMVYSTYALQLNVYVLPHAHNILLQIWMEQGLAGIFAFLWLILAFYRWVWNHHSGLGWLALGGLAATSVMLIHGLMDAALWYSDVTRPFLFLPVALTIAGTNIQEPISRPQTSRIDAVPAKKFSGKSVPGWLLVPLDPAPSVPLVIACLASLALVFTLKQPVATWYANLGSLAQTRTELGQYSFPDSLVEYTRRQQDLTQAETYFHAALEIDPENVTANQRLGMIALARGEYGDALEFGNAALRADPNSPITWQVLGDAYLALGQPDQAYAYWSHLEKAADKLNVEAATRYDRVGDQVRANWTREMELRIEQTR